MSCNAYLARRGDEAIAGYTVVVDDNFRFQDGAGGYPARKLDSYAEALALARGIVERSLRALYRPGMSAGELLASYRGFGEDPYIVPDEGHPHFSAWDCAEALCGRWCRD